MQKDNKKKSHYDKMFDALVGLGFNPLNGYMTVYDPSDNDYRRYAKKRMSLIKRGLDPVYRLKEMVNFVIYKIK